MKKAILILIIAGMTGLGFAKASSSVFIFTGQKEDALKNPFSYGKEQNMSMVKADHKALYNDFRKVGLNESRLRHNFADNSFNAESTFESVAVAKPQQMLIGKLSYGMTEKTNALSMAAPTNQYKMFVSEKQRDNESKNPFIKYN
ncbi:MAG: hypothetical protein ACRC5H_00275 [Treponemataceae bacterium]